MTTPQHPDRAAWHAGPDLLERYAAGTDGPASAASVEAHLLACGECRVALTRFVDPDPLRAVWESVEAAVTTPPPTAVQRGLERLGLPERDALLVVAAPALRSSWALGVLLSLLLAALAVGPDGALGSLVFLLLAPLVPVAAVAVSYSRELDPVWEATAATPYPRLRLVLLRSLAVVATAVPAAVLAAPLMTGPAWQAVAWLLPAAACLATTLALATWFEVTHAALGVAVAWALAVLVIAGPGLREPLLVLAEPLLLSYALVAVAASALCWARHDHLLVSRRPT